MIGGMKQLLLIHSTEANAWYNARNYNMNWLGMRELIENYVLLVIT